MLYGLELENFYSVCDSQVIDLRMAENVPDIPGRFVPIHVGSNDQVPKIVTFFGPNASGKSTVLRALTFLSWFVQHSFLQLPAPSDQPRRGQAFSPVSRLIRATLQISRRGSACILRQRSTSRNQRSSGMTFAGMPTR
jgi:hypothetical protein